MTNLGSAKALDVEIGFYLDGKKVATRQKLVVEPKQSVPATASFKPKQIGRLNLQARIDSKRALQKVHRKQHRADALLIVSEPRQPMQLKPGLPSLTEVRKPGGITLPRATEAIADAGTRRPLPADLVVEQPTYHVNLAAVPASGTSAKQPGISFILRNDGPAHIDQHQYRRSLARLLVSNRPIPRLHPHGTDRRLRHDHQTGQSGHRFGSGRITEAGTRRHHRQQQRLDFRIG